MTEYILVAKGLKQKKQHEINTVSWSLRLFSYIVVEMKMMRDDSMMQ